MNILKKAVLFLVVSCLFLSLPSIANPPVATTTIVAETSFLHNSGNFPLTTLFTTSSDDTYRMSIVFTTAPAPPTGGTSGSGTLSWSDNRGARTTSVPFSIGGSTSDNLNQQFFTLPMHVATGNNITFQFTWNNPTIASDYDFYTVVEQF